MKHLLPLLFITAQLSGIGLAQTPPIPEPGQTDTPPPSNAPPVDYPGAIWTPAAEGNFGPQNRPHSTKIDRIVIHDIEGPASVGINIFQRKGAEVSAHYIVGGDGRVFQMVREHNVGWHAGNREINHRSIGIETEGYAYRPGWYSTLIYETEARLVRDITQRYGIPRDRTHIISHAEVPNPRDPTRFGGVSGHTDPGPYWDWATFMTLVRNDAHLVESIVPRMIRPGEVLPVSVTFKNEGDDPWPTNTARNPKIALQASGPVVVLATEQGRPSSLFNLQGWVSPTVAAGAATETLPGDSARFEFTLRGPRELGPWVDQLRLTTMPTAAQGVSPVSFGDKIMVSTSVIPWVVDAAPANALGEGSAVSTAVARWNVALPIGGIYAVYVNPPRPSKTRRQRPFSYLIDTLDGPRTVQVQAKDGGIAPIFGGYFQFAEPTDGAPAVEATLQSAPEGVDGKNAGNLRFVGPFPKVPTTPPDMIPVLGMVRN